MYFRGEERRYLRWCWFRCGEHNVALTCVGLQVEEPLNSEFELSVAMWHIRIVHHDEQPDRR